jgi:hypothetical protein
MMYIWRQLSPAIKIGVITIALVILASIGYGIYQIVTNGGKIAVTVSVVPDDAKITINNASVNAGTTYLVPGQTYTVKATKDGFADYSATQYIDATNHVITIEMTAVTDAAKQWQQDNQSKYQSVEGLAGAQANATGEAFTAKNPITTALPLDNMIYTIGYISDLSDPSGNSIILTVSAAEGYRNSAVEAIRNLGYDPTQFKIQFNDYTNPFSS